MKSLRTKLPPGLAAATGKRRKGTTPEGAVLRACLDLLELRRIYAFRNNSGCLPDASGRPVRFGKVGSADILGLLPPRGRLLAVEAKAPGGKLTDAQREFLEGVRAAGGVAVCVSDPAILADILDQLLREWDARFSILGVRESS